MSVIFRNATEKDIPIIAELAAHIWKKHYITIITMEQIEYMLKEMYSTESLLQQMRAHENFMLAYDDNKPVGYLSMSTKDKKNYFLHKFYVEVAEQRKGIGSALFTHILNEIKTAESIELTVNRNNYKAINFYFKHGFFIKAVADFDIGNGFFMNDFIMVKK